MRQRTIIKKIITDGFKISLLIIKYVCLVWYSGLILICKEVKNKYKELIKEIKEINGLIFINGKKIL